MLKAGIPWDEIQSFKIWELAAWGYAASRLDGVEKAGLTSAIAIAFGSLDEARSREIQSKWDLSDIFGLEETKENSSSNSSGNEKGQSKTASGGAGKSNWGDLVNFFSGLSGSGKI